MGIVFNFCFTKEESTVTEPVSSKGKLESQGLTALPPLLVEWNEPRIYLLVDVRDEEVRPEPLVGILKR